MHPCEERYTPGRYYVAVYAYGGSACTYTLLTSLTPVPPITPIRTHAVSQSSPWNYFRYQCRSPGTTRLHIKITSISPNSSLYLSKTLYYPTLSNCHWYTSSPFPHTNCEPSLDPYTKLPKQYIKPKSKWSKRSQIEAVQGYEDSLDGLILCFDTENDDIFYYFGVFSPEKCEFQVSITEIELIELLSEKNQHLFQLFNSYFRPFHGSELSLSDRKRLNLPDYGQFTYGEIDFIWLIPLLEICEIRPGEVFWDLGCGVGKCLIGAALLYPELREVKGVELLESLYTACEECVRRVEGDRLRVLHGDIVGVDWRDGDVVYVSSLCFPESLLREIEEKMRRLKAGSRILSLKAFLPPPEFHLVRTCKVTMSWGPTSIYLYKRV